MTNHKGSFILLITVLIILGLSYLVFSLITGQIDGTSNVNNATAANMATATNIIPLVIVMVSIILGLALFSYYVSNIQRYQIINIRIRKILDFLDTTTYYFGYGLLAFAIFGSIGLSTYLLYRLTLIPGVAGTSGEIGKYILLLIVAYFAITGIGYVFKKKLWDKYKARKAEKENWDEIPKEHLTL